MRRAIASAPACVDVGEEHGELVAAGSGAAGAIGRGFLESFGDGAKHAVSGDVPVKVVDPLEMVEVEQEQDAGALRIDHLVERAHELAAVGEAGTRIGVGVAVCEALGRFIGFERFLQVLRSAPAEQDDGDVEEEGDLERARRIRKPRAGNGSWNDPAAERDEQQNRRDRRASRNDVAARDANGFAPGAFHGPVHSPVHRLLWQEEVNIILH